LQCLAEIQPTYELLNHPLGEVRIEVLRKLDLIDSTLKTITSDENEFFKCRTKALSLISRYKSDDNLLEWLLKLYRDETDFLKPAFFLLFFNQTHRNHSDTPIAD
jgi:hypothetical protein